MAGGPGVTARNTERFPLIDDEKGGSGSKLSTVGETSRVLGGGGCVVLASIPCTFLAHLNLGVRGCAIKSSSRRICREISLKGPLSRSSSSFFCVPFSHHFPSSDRKLRYRSRLFGLSADLSEGFGLACPRVVLRLSAGPEKAIRLMQVHERAWPANRYRPSWGN